MSSEQKCGYCSMEICVCEQWLAKGFARCKRWYVNRYEIFFKNHHPLVIENSYHDHELFFTPVWIQKSEILQNKGKIFAPKIAINDYPVLQKLGQIPYSLELNNTLSAIFELSGLAGLINYAENYV